MLNLINTENVMMGLFIFFISSILLALTLILAKHVIQNEGTGVKVMCGSAVLLSFMFFIL
jgi:uncharacterized membrane protein YvlD (DUF360 family)